MVLVSTKEFQDEYIESIRQQNISYEASAKVFIIEYHCEVKVGRKVCPIYNAKACICAFTQPEAINELKTILETQHNGILTEIPTIMEVTKLPMVFSYPVKENLVLREGDRILRNIKLRKEETIKIIEKTGNLKPPTSKIVKDKLSTIITRRPTL